MASINTYVSFKKVTKFPKNAEAIAEGLLSGAGEFAIGVDPDNPALLIGYERAGKEVLVRVGLQRLVDSIAAAEAATDDEWEPLRKGQDEWWGNTILSAHVTAHNGMIHISYHRRDRAPIRDWRVGQRIKDEIAGPEWEGLELYPAQSRVVDTSNEYHLWCFPSLPFGFDIEDRLTQDQVDILSEDGAVQRDDPSVDCSRFDAADRVNYPIRTPANRAGFGLEES